MSSMRLFNSLTRKVEEFKPLNPPAVGMYTCGPTVYDYQHVGNFRTMTLSDILHRVLLANDYSVKSIQNITDIDDKIIKSAKERDLPLAEFTSEYTTIFFEDLVKLNILPASNYPKATDHIEKMVKYIEELIDKGLAYIEKDGSVYFDISKFPGYGKLSKLDKRQLKPGTRILSDEYSKDDVQDFALWKAVEPAEVGFNSPWGRGRPGWHIECSVMSQEYLGETFDIHVGGVDLLFPHHDNEIAQSEGKTGKPFARFFIHGEFLFIEGQKMSKSLKNFLTLKNIEAKGVEPLALRHLYLTAHYRDKLNLTTESLSASQNALTNLRWEIGAWEQPGELDAQYYQQFLQSANNDLNLPQAMAVMWDMVKSDLTTDKKAATLLKMDEILGLNLRDYIAQPVQVPEEVQKLVEEREEARKRGDYQRSDELRKKINDLGYKIEDTNAGPRIRKS